MLSAKRCVEVSPDFAELIEPLQVEPEVNARGKKRLCLDKWYGNSFN